MRSPSAPTASSARGEASPSTPSASQSSDSSPRRAVMGSSTRWRSSPRSPSAVGGRLVLGANGRRALDDGQPLALDRRLCAAEQQVRDPAHRGRDDGDLVAVGLHRADDVGRLPHGLGAADRRAAELQNESLSHARQSHRAWTRQEEMERQAVCRGRQLRLQPVDPFGTKVVKDVRQDQGLVLTREALESRPGDVPPDRRR